MAVYVRLLQQKLHSVAKFQKRAVKLIDGKFAASKIGMRIQALLYARTKELPFLRRWHTIFLNFMFLRILDVAYFEQMWYT